MRAKSRLNQPVGVDAIAVEFETSVIEDEIHATSFLSSELLGRDVFPDLLEVVSENILFRSSKVFSSSRLKTFDIFLTHLHNHDETDSVQSKFKTLWLKGKGKLTLMRRDRSVEFPQRQT